VISSSYYVAYSASPDNVAVFREERKGVERKEREGRKAVGDERG